MARIRQQSTEERGVAPRGIERRRNVERRRFVEQRNIEQRNMELMQTLDDAWNRQDTQVFRDRHKPDVIVRWPGQPEPTVGLEDHLNESIDFWRTFPDQKLDNRPYRVFFASGDWTCSIARFRGTMTGPMKGADGKETPPTGRSFDVEFCTVARWDDGQIVEENLMYDLVTFMKQLGLGG